MGRSGSASTIEARKRGIRAGVRTTHRRLPQPAALLVGATAVWCAPFAAAFADPGDPIELRSRTASADPRVPLTPTFEHDLTWTRMVLEDDRLLQRYDDGDVSLDVNSLLDLERDPFALQARALTTVVSAVVPLVSKGFSVFRVVRNGRLRQRHALSAHWRSRGLKLVWRIDF